MKYGFYAITGIGLILFQTTICPGLPFYFFCYDLLLPVVISAGIYRSPREGILGVLVLGFLMDQLSGAPFGLYITTYLWLFLAVKLARRFIHVKNLFFLVLISAVGVVMENTLMLISAFLQGTEDRMYGSIANTIVWQTVVASVTAPLMVSGLEYLSGKWNRWLAVRSSGERKC